MKSSFSKRAVAVILSVMIVFSMIPMMAFSASAETKDSTANLIATEEDLYNAAVNGGTYTLSTDITVTGQMPVCNDLTIYGENHAITANFPENYEYSKTIFMLADPTKTLELSIVRLDGGKNASHAISANQVVANEGNVITLSGCNVSNFMGYSYIGAVYAYSRATVNLQNSFFRYNTTQDPNNYCSGADVWAGAAATLNIDGGMYEEIFANANAGSGAKVNITNNAYVDELILEDDGKKAEVTVEGYSHGLNIITPVNSEEKLINACAAGGKCILTDDITLTKRIDIKKEMYIYGNGHTITGNIPDEAYGNGGKAMFMLNQGNTEIWLELQDVTLDGANKTPIAISTEGDRTINNNGITVYMNNCTVKNFVGYSYIGAVYVYSQSVFRAFNCTFTGNTTQLPDNLASGADIWAGAAASVHIGGDDSTYDEIFINANKSSGGKIYTVGSVSVKELVLEKDGKEATTDIYEGARIENIILGGININHNVAIGIAGYDTLEEALEAAKDGDVITSVSPEYQVTTAVNTAKNVTLDGFTFNMTSYQRNPLVMTGTDVAVKNCTFTGSFYNALETTQSKTAPLNSLTVEGCTFDAGRNNSVNVFSFVDGAQVNVSNNTFNCGDDCEAIRISNYTNAQNVKFTVDNNTYAPKNGDVVTQWDAFILFQDTTTDNTTDFTGINVAVTNLNTTSANPLYAVCDKPCNDTTATVETMVTKDDVRVDLRTLQAQVVLADGMVGIKVVGENVTIDGTAVENGTLYLTPAQAADFDKEYAIVADGVTGTFTMNGYINALTDENAKAALRAFEVYAKAAANVFSGGSYDVASTYDFSKVDATPVKDDIYCGVSIDCSSKTQLIVYADNVAAGTAVKVNGADTSIVTVDCGSNTHTAIIVPVNSINDAVTIEADGKTITYSVKQASKLLSGVSGYEVLAAALANYGDALVAYTA